MIAVPTAARRLQEGSLYVLLFLLPFSNAAIEISFGLLLAGWLIERLHHSTRYQSLWLRPQMRPMLWAVLAYLGACALSIIGSTHRDLSVAAFIYKWLEYLLFFVILADLMQRPQAASRAWLALALSAGAVVIEAATQEWFGRGIFRGRPIGLIWNFGRMTGPYENPIDLATYLMVVIPVLFAYAKTRRGVARAAVWELLVLLMVCMIRTQARSAWMGCGLGLLAMSGWHVSMRRSVLVIAAGILMIGGVGYLRDGHALKAFVPSSVGTADRKVMWQAAIHMIQDRPVLGQGLNTFMANYLDYWVGGERQPRYAHNCYLQVAAETGLVGLAAFLWLLGALFWRLLRVRHQEGAEAVLVAGLFAGLLAFAVQAAFDTNFYSLRQVSLFWVLAGLALGLSARITGSKTS